MIQKYIDGDYLYCHYKIRTPCVEIREGLTRLPIKRTHSKKHTCMDWETVWTKTTPLVDEDDEEWEASA